MKILTNILDAIWERQVEMPAAADAAVIQRGVDAVVACVERNRRLAEEADRRRQEKLSRQPRESGSYLIRYKTISPDDDKRPQTEPVITHGKRPPNLKAAVLSFSARLVKYVRERCEGKAPMAYKRAGLDRKVYSKIVSNDRATVSKQTALQLAIGLQLSRREADEFLRAAGYALSETIPLDCAFAYCIEHGIWNILDVNGILVRAGLPAMKLTL